MPRNDGSGPLGQGPMTGRGLGNCNISKNSFNSKENDSFGGGVRKFFSALGRGLACRSRNGQRKNK